MDSTLTATGVIATILSVIFAVAAYFVQHKKNQARLRNGSESSVSEADEAHVVTTRHGASMEKRRQGVAPSDGAMESAGKSPAPAAGEPAKPVFKKYTANGGYEENPALGNEDEALWE